MDDRPFLGLQSGHSREPRLSRGKAKHATEPWDGSDGIESHKESGESWFVWDPQAGRTQAEPEQSGRRASMLREALGSTRMAAWTTLLR